MLSKAFNLYTHFKERFRYLGYGNVTITGLKSDALDMLIDEMKPDLVIIGAGFYKSAIVYMTAELIRRHKDINIAIVSISPEEFPPDIAMKCIVNGVKSYITVFDGLGQFYTGIDLLKKGRNFVSPSAMESKEIRDEQFTPYVEITERERAVMRLIRDGFTGKEITKELEISINTVNLHKKELYKKIGVRNENELIRFTEDAGMISENEMTFYPDNYDLSPKPNKMRRREWETENEENRIKAMQSNTQTNIRSFYDYKNEKR